MLMKPSELAIKGGPRAVTIEWERDWPLIGPEEIEAVASLMERRVLSIYDRSGIIAEFEDSFADYHALGERRPYVVSHNSGTSALNAAYFGLGLRPGDEVIVPTYTFLATVVPLMNCGAVPVFADMDPETLTAGVVWVHMANSASHEKNCTGMSSRMRRGMLSMSPTSVRSA